MTHNLPVLGFVAAASNAGKTTLITQLISEFAKRNIRVSVIKHAHHQFDIDHSGKDSFNIREAGAVQTLVASSQRWALMTEVNRIPGAMADNNLDDLLKKLNHNYADIIFTEGFKHALMPKIEVFNSTLHTQLLANNDPKVIGIVSDIATLEPPLAKALPHFHRDEIVKVADFIQAYFSLT